jgi:hypothetical protein
MVGRPYRRRGSLGIRAALSIAASRLPSRKVLPFSLTIRGCSSTVIVDDVEDFVVDLLHGRWQRNDTCANIRARIVIPAVVRIESPGIPSSPGDYEPIVVVERIGNPVQFQSRGAEDLMLCHTNLREKIDE